MPRSELVDALTGRQSNLGKTDVELVVNCLFAQMTNPLAHGERIEIRGFGSFTLLHKPPCIGRILKLGKLFS
jgi:integration host factor subunit beta